MTDQPIDLELTAPSGDESPPRMPSWVKVTAILAGLLVLLFLVAQLTGLAGEHGPGRHMSGQAPASTSTWLGQPMPSIS